jgi:hypothetical protein
VTPRWRDPRVWVGIAITVFFLWLSLRDVPFVDVGKAIAHANWWILIPPSVLSYFLLVWLRALRWRHLTNPIQEIDRGPMARATAVGFMANNIFPLRMGEVVRCWYLKQETGVSTASLFGTVILERVVDIVAVIVMVLVLVATFGSEGDGRLEQGAYLLLPVALLPIAGLVALRVAPDAVLSVMRFCLRPFPDRVEEGLVGLVERFIDGLGALRGGTHVFWIVFHTVVIWGVQSIIPVIAAFLALGIDLGGIWPMLGAAWTTQAAIGVAVALPSAPGFFGIFHFACKLALVRFGVEPDLAVAAGTLIHAIMWITLTSLGFAVLRIRQTSLGDVDEALVEPGERSSG